jgi:ArsR family transcriptional regulator
MKERFEAQAMILRAMAHPTRLMIVDELKSGPRCVCELTELVGADTSTVSKHLSVLKSAGIIVDVKKGLKVLDSVLRANADKMNKLLDSTSNPNDLVLYHDKDV